MKIVYFGYFLHYGGGPQAVVSIAKRLSEQHQVEVIDFYGNNKEFLNSLKQSNIKTYILIPEAKNFVVGHLDNKVVRLLKVFLKIPFYLKLRYRLIKNILQIGPDVLWTNMKLAIYLIGHSYKLRKIPLVRCVIECPKPFSIRGLYKYLMRKRVDMVIAVSRATAEGLKSSGINSERIRIISDTIDVAKIKGQYNIPLEFELPSAVSEIRILLPATITPSKGQHTAVEAVAELKRRGHNPVLWIAGISVNPESDYVLKLKRMVKTLDIERNVHFLGWQNNVPALMAKSDVVVFPSHSEGFGLVVLEAMFLKKPIVTTWVGGIKDQVEDGVNGMIFPVDDCIKMADCIEQITNDSELASKLIENGYKTATEKFSPDENTRKYNEAFQEAVKIRKEKI